MSSKLLLLSAGWAGLLFCQTAMATWQSDCQAIESGGPSTGACASIQARVSDLQPYTVLQPFQDYSADGSGLSGKFPWGTPIWASTGSGTATTPLQSDSGTTGTGTSSSTSTDTTTFQ